jgi:hypothetical protein
MINNREIAFLYDSDECKEKIEAFYVSAYGKRGIAIFLGLLAAAFLLVVLGFILDFRLLIGGLTLLGLDVIVFPFGTPQTLSYLGIRKAVILIRVIGLVIMLATQFFWLLYWFLLW